MKYIYLFLLTSLLITLGCKKQEDKPIFYQPITKGTYVVKDGTISITNPDSTITFTAPKDSITVYTQQNEYNPGIIVIAKKNIRSIVTYQSFSFNINVIPVSNTKYTRYTASFNPNYTSFLNTKTIDAWATNGESTILVTDYNTNGVLMNATLSSPGMDYYFPKPLFTFTGTVNLKLNKE